VGSPASRLEIRNPGGLHNSLTEENLYAGCQPVRRNQILAGFLRDYESPATGRRYMETRGEGFLTLVSRSLELSGRRPELVNMGGAVKLTLFAGCQDATDELLRSPANAEHLARSIAQYRQGKTSED
jgi:predicted HTH transcriptional regulator